ncbi:MAG: preprotein translocase subunit SecA [Abditibacteriota bacterium]|nr:preprotein translocase subunit SecA [Abditibacteriota bacterium]
MSFLSNLFDQNERIVNKCRKVVEVINGYEPEYEKLPDEALKEKTAEFRRRLEEGQTLDDLLPEAFAPVREPSKRTLGQRHYDVQLIGGIILHQGRIAEMKTGEGKTLVATLPLYLNALSGKGAHLVTVNDYLSKRDARWNGPVFHLLGLSVGSIHGQSAETGDIGRSYMYDPDYTVEYETPTEWNGLRPVSRKEAYDCDITYGTNHEFGFDYLRDNMCFRKEDLTQRELNFAIVDEVDSILIDEARTPLIISGRGTRSSEMYVKADRWVSQLVKEKHYTIDEKARTAMLTEEGTAKVEELTGCGNLAASENFDLNFYIQAALKAHAVFIRDKDYVVKDGQIIIVDEFTGRLMYGRRWSEGLHQAVEAKEHCKIAEESQTLATITYQNFFRLYTKLSGMTGTAMTEEEEFKKIYGLDVIEIPTNKPSMRKDEPDVVYKTEDHKFRGITMEILAGNCRQQPMLVGTRSIGVSERVAERLLSERLQTLCVTELIRSVITDNKAVSKELSAACYEAINRPFEDLDVHKFGRYLKELGLETNIMADSNLDRLLPVLGLEESYKPALRSILKNGIRYNILNAKYHEKEAEIISQAGRRGAVTIATNMAGRGVDITLGGIDNDSYDPENEPEIFVPVDEASCGWDFATWKKNNPGKWETMSDNQKDVFLRGGLKIIGTERHESRRIDNQLRGRSGRQGDPGCSKFFVSFEDELIRLFGDKANHPLLQSWDPGIPINVKLLSSVIEKAQKKVEYHHFDQRKTVLQFDDVMNEQRHSVYSERRKIIEGVDLKETVTGHLADVMRDSVTIYCPEGVAKSEWDYKGLYRHIYEILPLPRYIQEAELSQLTDRQELTDRLQEIAAQSYEDKEKELGSELMREMERYVAMRSINDAWVDHLSAMDFLRDGIGLRGYAQKDPVNEYKREAYYLYEDMMHMIQDTIVKTMFKLQFVREEENRKPAFRKYENVQENTQEGGGEAPKNAPQARKIPKVGRNEPCPCGSGKKFKKCCLPKYERGEM